MGHTLQGIATVSLWAADHKAAVKWYSKLLDCEPYFTRPGYAEFRVGDYETEIGIIDSAYAPKSVATKGPAGAVMYWQVKDVAATMKQLLAIKAIELEAPKDRGNNFVTASIADPFGNILGIMHNPHYLEVLKSAKKG